MPKRTRADVNDPRAHGAVEVIRPKAQHLVRMRYNLKAGHACREFVMRELDAQDELTAAQWADAKMTQQGGNKVLSMMGTNEREAMRLSFVSVDGIPVNIDGVPFIDIDGWPIRTMRLVRDAFEELNGVAAEEIKSFKAGAEVVLEDAPTNSRPEVVAEDTSGARETA